MQAVKQPKRIAPELVAVAAVALSLSLGMVFFGFAKQGLVANAGDPYDYGKIARGLLEHGFTKLTRRSAMLYPHLLWLIYALGGNDFVVLILQCLFHVGTSVLVFVMGRHLYNARTGLIAGLFTAINPVLLRYVADLHTETMLVFLATLTVWCAVRFYERPSVLNGIALGAVGMVTTLTKGVILPFLLIFGVISLVRSLRPKSRSMTALRGVIAMFLTMTVLVSPWTYRNYKVTGGRFVLLTPGSPDAFLRGYIFTRLEFATLRRPPYIDAENECNNLFRGIARDAGTTWELDEVADDVNNGRVMKRMIIEHPFDTARKVMVGFFTFWYEMTTLKNSLVLAALALVNWILAFIGLKRTKREGRPSWLLLLPIVVMNVFVAFLIPLGRYSAPVLPTLAILAAFGVDTLIERMHSRHAQPSTRTP